MVTDFEVLDTLAYLNHNPRTLMAEDCRKRAFWIIAREREGVGMADTGGFDLHHHFARTRTADVDLGYFQGFAGFKCNCGSTLHGDNSLLLDRRSMP